MDKDKILAEIDKLINELQQQREIVVKLENFTKDFEIEGTTIIDYFGDDDEVTIPYGITEIGCGAFQDSKVKKVNIPLSVKKIGAAAFLDCKNLESIILPNNFREISSDAFYGCTNLTISIPEDCKYDYRDIENCKEIIIRGD